MQSNRTVCSDVIKQAEPKKFSRPKGRFYFFRLREARCLHTLRAGFEQRSYVFSAEKTSELVPSLNFLTKKFKAKEKSVLAVQLPEQNWIISFFSTKLNR